MAHPSPNPHFLKAIALSCVLLCLAACSSGEDPAATATSDSNTSNTGGTAAAATVVVQGNAILGLVAGATVTAYPILPAGGLDTNNLLATTITDSSGNYSLSFPTATAPTGPIGIQLTGGSYQEEATGLTVNLTGKTYTTLVPSVGSPNITVALGPLPDMAFQKFQTQMQSGLPTGTTLAQLATNVNYQVSQVFGLSDIVGTLPSNPSGNLANDSAGQYALVMAGLSKAAQNAGTDSTAMMQAYTRKFIQDGHLSDIGNSALTVTDATGATRTITPPTLAALGILVNQIGAGSITLAAVTPPAGFTPPIFKTVPSGVAPGSPPYLFTISPAVGLGTTRITLTGDGFTEGSSVSIAGANCTAVTLINARTLTCTTPILNLVGPFPVKVTQPSGLSVTYNGGHSYIGSAEQLSMSPAQNTACAIAEGKARCWGDNSTGQLGNNSRKNSLSPVPVSGLSAGVQAIAVGNYSSCAIVNGAAWCWGSNTFGQLGNNSKAPALIPVRVAGLSSGVQAIAVGEDSACAVVNGSAKCWGRNQNGQLGNPALADQPGYQLAPVQVSGLTSEVQSISVGTGFTCAVVRGGAQCWGLNTSGQLGNHTTTGSNAPVSVSDLFSGVQAISAGNGFTCAIVNGGAQCWGQNGNGQLGNNSTTRSTLPVAVSGLANGVLSISASQNFACANVNNSAKCWGYNGYGQLGDNSTLDSKVPVQVSTLTSGVQGIATGHYSTCAIVNGGTQCWRRSGLTIGCWGNR